MQDQPTAFVLAPGEESKPIDFGFRSAAGRVVVAATDVNSLYVSSFKIGNKDMNISGTGPGEPLSNYPTDELGFSGGNTVAIRLRNTGSTDQHVQVSVRLG
jgi:hypothetical protein